MAKRQAASARAAQSGKARRTRRARVQTGGRAIARRGRLARLRVDVAWGDITKVKGDAYVVGHYMGVLPQNAEWALDCAVSGTDDPSRLVLTDLTRRGAIRGSLGDVVFFPWKGRGQIIVAGMGRLGTFREPQLATLARSAAQALGRLLDRPTVCTVLIGSGYGNLKTRQSVSGLLAGVGQALAADPSLGFGTLRIVERRLDKAYEILQAVKSMIEDFPESYGVELEVVPEVIEQDDAGGLIPIPYGFSLMLAALAQACYDATGSRLRKSLSDLLGELPDPPRKDVIKELQSRGNERNRRRLGLAFRLVSDEDGDQSEVADRISFSHDGTSVRSAAITNLTTVAARDLDVRLAWVDRIVDELQAPAPDVADERARNAFRHLVHADLVDKLQSQAPLVLELDRAMARVPWEMLQDGAPKATPLGLQRPVARQLRTSYSARIPDAIVDRGFKALVVGDPDDSLSYARAEATRVAEMLREHGIDVELRLGSANELGLGQYPGVAPADLYEILPRLRNGEFDLVHYSGHALFFPDYPDRSGWQFKGELLTASKLEGVERPPRLIVANACVSARVSEASWGKSTAVPTSSSVQAGAAATAIDGRPPGDSRLVASLADEFFRRGVADYIGTAWEVPEGPAKLFAETFYAELLRGWKADFQQPPAARSTLGAAVLKARQTLYDKRNAWGELGTVWAAYQHYGDPTRRLFD